MSNITTNPAIEAMMDEAKAMYPNINPYLLRVALHTAIKDDEMRKKKELKRGQYLTDVMEKEIREYKTEYEGLVEIIPPTPEVEELTITDTTADTETQTE